MSKVMKGENFVRPGMATIATFVGFYGFSMWWMTDNRWLSFLGWHMGYISVFVLYWVILYRK